MATKVSGDFGLSGQSLIEGLKRRTAKREGLSTYVGLKRSSALADLENPSEGLDNILRKISFSDSAEEALYGSSYNSQDWFVTKDFIDEGIDRSFLSRLAGAGTSGSSAIYRVRIQDRISLLNSFYGEGSFAGLHSGPDARFYKAPRTKEIGFIKFTFNQITGDVTVVELKKPDGTTLTSAEITGSESVVVLDVTDYTLASGQKIGLSGLGVALKLEGSAWNVFGQSSIENLKGIDEATKQGDNSVFSTLTFRLVRPYSFIHRPKWFTESPNQASDSIAGSSDDLEPSTSSMVLENNFGEFSPLKQRGYWYSKAYVETRWTASGIVLTSEDRNSEGSIIQDSNMRWQQPPSLLSSQNYNWGIRWDGYLRLLPGKYAFEVWTNVDVKIDMAINADGSWENIFSSGNRLQTGNQRYISPVTFSIDQIQSKYKSVYGENSKIDWDSYIPISIRLYHGGPDKAEEEFTPEQEPNLFIKTLSSEELYEVVLSGSNGNWTLSENVPVNQEPYVIDRLIRLLQSGDTDLYYEITDVPFGPAPITLSTDGTTVTGTTDNTEFEVNPGTRNLRVTFVDQKFYSEEHSIEVTSISTDPVIWQISGLTISGIISKLQDPFTSASYTLTSYEGDILPTAIKLNLETDGTIVTSDTPDTLDTGNYTLTVSPSPKANTFTALWKGRIQPPSPTYRTYSDLLNVNVSGEYYSDIKKVPFDIRPDWWKVTEGHPFDYTQSPTNLNNPIDGVLKNEFKKELKSDAEGVGLYGNGSGVYSEIPNIIIGESRFTDSDELGSNYGGLRLVPNLLGEGGKVTIKSLPYNNALFNDSFLLGPNDLGGGTNHLTAASGNFTVSTIKLHLSNVDVPDTSSYYNKYYSILVCQALPASGSPGIIYFSVSADKFYTWDGSGFVEKTDVIGDDPTAYGYEPFSNSAWSSPTSAFVVETSAQSDFSASDPLVAPLTMTVEKVTIKGSNFLQFSTNQRSLIRPLLSSPGDDTGKFNGRFIRFYSEKNGVFLFSRVDTGESLSFSDVLKLTYVSGELDTSNSEIPKPISDRVIPLGFDKPEFSTGLCYPPYFINNPSLSAIAIDDTSLYDLSTPKGNYDVFWGDPNLANLGGKVLELTEKLEFQNVGENPGESAIEEISQANPVTISYNDYTNRMKIDIPVQGEYDEDMLEHIGNEEKVKESYYAYIKLP